MALSIVMGSVLYVNGPFAAGSYSDLLILWRNLKHELEEYEFVVVEEIYRNAKVARGGERSFDFDKIV